MKPGPKPKKDSEKKHPHRNRTVGTRRLGAQQRMFARLFWEYGLVNAGLAAKEAGYAHHDVAANRLLKNKWVKLEIIRLQERAKELTEDADIKEIVGGLTRDIRFDPRKLWDPIARDWRSIDDLDDATALALAGMEVSKDELVGAIVRTRIRYKFPDKRACRETLGKHLGMFTTKLELGVSDQLRTIIGALPPDLADAVGREVRKLLSGRRAA